MASRNKNYMLNDNFPKHISNATSTSDGLMSSVDKARLDELFEFGLLSPATPDNDGIMTKIDKVKLDGIEEGANNYTHPNDENTRHVSDSQIAKWDSQILYTNNKPTPVTIGGIEKGETFENISFSEMFNRLLYPYIDTSISNISVITGSSVVEKGTNVIITKISFDVNTPSLDVSESLYYEFKANGTAFHSTDISNRSVTVNVVKMINTDTSVSVTIQDKVNNKEKTFTLSNYTFVYPFYYGIVSDSDTINESLVKSKTKIVQTKGTKSLKFTTNNQKMMFAYPKSYGELKTIYDANNFNVINTFTKTEINISGPDSASVPYYVYINELSTVTDYSMQFIF